MTLLIASGITLTVLGILFLNPILKVFGASEEVLPYARDFMRIILIGNIFQSVSFGMNSYIRADGNPLIAMFTMLIGSICNAILGPLFIFVFKWGVSGAAFATVISQGISAVWVVSYFLGGRSNLKLHFKNLKLRLKVVKGITAIGIAPFAMQLAASLLNVILNNSLQTYGGDVAISAMGLVTSINMLILMPIFGINQGAQPIIGYNYGAKKYKRVKDTLKLAITAATVVVLIGFLATQFLSRQLIGIFNREDLELLNVGVKTLRIYLMFLPIIGFQIVSANYFQAVGKPKQAMILSLSRQVLVLIPAIIILPHFYGFKGILAAGPLADFLSSVITGIWLFMELRHLKIDTGKMKLPKLQLTDSSRMIEELIKQ